MAYILALDQGTTSSRAILFGEDGAVAAQAQRELTQIYPRGGWVEHDPFEILHSQLDAAREALDKAGARPEEIVAAGIANQRETTVVWERQTGKPVYNAIVWQDRRTASACRKLNANGAGEMVKAKTGLLIDPYFSGTKVAWILDRVGGARAQAEAGRLAFGTVDSWLIWNLTGGKRHLTDYTNASRTMLFNIVDGKWDQDLLKLLRIPESMLPEVVWSSERLGPLSASPALGAIELAGVAGDQQAALFGQLCVQPGEAKNTYGTGCFLLQNLGEKLVFSEQPLITTLVCSPARKLEYGLEGSIFIGGAVVEWLRDSLNLISSAAGVEQLASTVGDADGVVLVPAFVGLGAPHWDPYAGGLLIGLRRDTRPGHIARAALESIAFQVMDVLEAMNSAAEHPVHALRADGAAAANNMLMQFQADLLGLPVIRPQFVESTALGAAYLAGLASGLWQGLDSLRKQRHGDKIFEPRMDRRRAAEARDRWRSAVERSRHWNNRGNNRGNNGGNNQPNGRESCLSIPSPK